MSFRRILMGLALGLVLGLGFAPLAQAQDASLLPNGQQQFSDANGAPYASGTVQFYIPTTTTPKATWSDPGETVPNPNPVVLDSAGRATIFGSGIYRQVLKDQFGALVWDKLTMGGLASLGQINGPSLLGQDSTFGPGPVTSLSPLQVNNMLALLTNVVTYGADPTGIADSTSAINAALATCGTYIPPGLYKTTATLTTGSCASPVVLGAGKTSVIINLHSTTAEGFITTGSATEGTISGFSLTRTGIPTSSATGFDIATNNQLKLEWLQSSGSWVGIKLGTTAWGVVHNVISQNNYSDGVLIAPPSAGQAQWTFDNVLSQANDGYGFSVVTTGTGSVNMGEWENAYSFANTKGGMWFVGSAAAPLEGIYLTGAYANGDGDDEYHFETYSQYTPTMIVNAIANDAGFVATGHAFQTPAGAKGNGFNFTGSVNGNSNHAAVLTNVNSYFNAFDGVRIDNTLEFSLTNVVAEINGTAGNLGKANGIETTGVTTGTISGGVFGNIATVATFPQVYGLVFANASGITVVGGTVQLNTQPAQVFIGAGALTCFGLQGYTGSCTTGGGGTGTVTSVNSGAGLTGGPITTSGSLSLAPIASHALLSNVTGGSAPPIANTLSDTIDAAIASTRGDILYRGASSWSALAPGMSGYLLSTGGAGADPSWINAVGTGTVTSIAHTVGGLVTLSTDPCVATCTVGLSAIADNRVLSNISGGSAVPAANSLGATMDYFFGNPSPQGALLYRGASSWTDIAPAATSGAVLISQGAAANPTWAEALSLTGTPAFAASGSGASDVGFKSVKSGASSIAFYCNGTGVDCLSAVGTYTTGIDLSGATLTNGIILPNSASLAWSKTGSGTAGLALDSGNILDLGTNATGILLQVGTTAAASIAPSVNNTDSLGTASFRWSTVDSVLGNFSGTVTGSAAAGFIASGAGSTAYSSTGNERAFYASGTASGQDAFEATGTYGIGLHLSATLTTGIDMSTSVVTNGMILPNAASLTWENAATNGTLGAYIDSGNQLLLGTGSPTISANIVTYVQAGGGFWPAVTNQQTLGKSGALWTAVWATNGTIQTSDGRSKDVLRGEPLGLDFIKRLRPVEYSWKDSPNGTHHGLVAQDLERALRGEPFAGLVAPANDNDRYGLNYDELVAPMVKAMQELSDENLILRERLDRLEARSAGGPVPANDNLLHRIAWAVGLR